MTSRQRSSWVFSV